MPGKSSGLQSQDRTRGRTGNQQSFYSLCSALRWELYVSEMQQSQRSDALTATKWAIGQPAAGDLLEWLTFRHPTFGTS